MFRAPRRPIAATSTLAIAALFFCSGFPALVYQLVWQRALFRIFGVNVESVTVVVTAFMVGLGLGSLAGGWLSRRRGLPRLPLFAALELATAAFGLASPRIFDAASALVLGLSLPLTAALALALVLVPTLLMGATLPLLADEVVRRTGNVGVAVGVLYDVNTLGAGVACLVSALALFPLGGLRGALAAAVAANVLVAAGALAAHALAARPRRQAVRAGAVPEADSRAAAAPDEAARAGAVPDEAPRAAAAPHASSRAATAPNATLRPASTPAARPPDARPPLGPAAALALCAAGGLVSLSHELFFFRAVSFATGSSASAFALTLSAFLVGLAAGSRRAARRSRASREAAARGAIRDLALAAAAGWAFLPALGLAATLGLGAVAVGLALVFLFARSAGAVFPTVAHLSLAAGAHVGTGTARLYVANIAGSAAGSVLTGFVLMDRLGLVALGQVLVLAALGYAACAAALVGGAPAPRPGRALAALAAGALAALALPRAAPLLLERLTWKREAGAHRPFVRVVENRSGIIAVDGTGTVFGHGMYDGRFNTDLVHDTNGIFRAYALGLFHAAPRDVLVVGLSSGSWAQVIASHPEVRSVTVVEINPGYAPLVGATPTVASVLANPKVRLETDDVRRWLRRHPDRRFDAIVANTTYHFRAHASALLSLEFLSLVGEHLAPGGVAIYNTTGSARVQRTGCLAFPHGLRLSNQLVVSAAPLDLDFARLRATLAAYRIDGRPAVDLRGDEGRRAVDGLLSLEAALAGPPGGAAAPAERCADILARTAHLEPVTDDNMGSEWRFALGME